MTSKRPESRTLGDLLDEIATVTPSAEAIVFRGERLDYAGLKTRVDDFARALLAVGIRKDDRVAVLVTNRTEWIIAAFAAAKIGAIVTAISTFRRRASSPGCWSIPARPRSSLLIPFAAGGSSTACAASARA
jgi:fatty-acyl-CoA synthase